MSARIACLHTARSNVDVFDGALARVAAPGAAALSHTVRADLLAEAEAAGGLTAALIRKTLAALAALRQEGDAVLLTCSTLGPAVGQVPPGGAPVLRADEALARDAVREDGEVVVLCAVGTTVGPTRDLFWRAAVGTGAIVRIEVVEGAWPLFKAGDLAGYHALIARAADRVGDGARVALAQASMAGAEALAHRPVLTSPAAGLRAALAAAREARSAR